MRLLQAAASAREKSRAIVDVLRAVQAAPSPRAVTVQVLQSLEERAQRLLAAIAAVGGAGISASVLGELTDLRDPEPLIGEAHAWTTSLQRCSRYSHAFRETSQGFYEVLVGLPLERFS